MCQKFFYSKLKDTDFFTFFNLREIEIINREDPRDSRSIHLKTGGFQDFIDISFHILNDEILDASLFLARNWIGDEKSINPFAKDIAKSFLAVLIPDGLNQEFKITLVQAIWNMKGIHDRVICIDEVIHNWESSNPEVRMFLDVFRGTASQHVINIDYFTLKMINEFDKNKNSIWFNINLSWNL